MDQRIIIGFTGGDIAEEDCGEVAHAFAQIVQRYLIKYRLTLFAFDKGQFAQAVRELINNIQFFMPRHNRRCIDPDIDCFAENCDLIVAYGDSERTAEVVRRAIALYKPIIYV